MKGCMYILKTSDEVEVIDLIAPPGLKSLQDAVDGLIEAVPYFDMLYDKVVDENEPDERPCVVFCNEEGKLDGLPANIMATMAWDTCLKRQGLQRSDVLVGNVVIITGDKKLLGAL